MCAVCKNIATISTMPIDSRYYSHSSNPYVAPMYFNYCCPYCSYASVVKGVNCSYYGISGMYGCGNQFNTAPSATNSQVHTQESDTTWKYYEMKQNHFNHASSTNIQTHAQETEVSRQYEMNQNQLNANASFTNSHMHAQETYANCQYYEMNQQHFNSSTNPINTQYHVQENGSYIQYYGNNENHTTGNAMNNQHVQKPGECIQFYGTNGNQLNTEANYVNSHHVQKTEECTQNYVYNGNQFDISGNSIFHNPSSSVQHCNTNGNKLNSSENSTNNALKTCTNLNYYGRIGNQFIGAVDSKKSQKKGQETTVIKHAGECKNSKRERKPVVHTELPSIYSCKTESDDHYEDLMDTTQRSRRKNLEIAGVPVTEGEDIYEILALIAAAIRVPFRRDLVLAALRYQTPRQMMMRNKSPPHIIVRFRTKREKQLWRHGCKGKSLTVGQVMDGFPDTRIYLNDHLTYRNMVILGKARKYVRHGRLLFAWTHDCRIFVRKTQPGPIYKVHSIVELVQIVYKRDQ